MIASAVNGHNINTIIFDMGNTLRTREPDEAVQSAAIKRLIEMLGIGSTSDSYWAELERRFDMYSYWAQEHLVELSEKEIWTQWIVPELPLARIEPIAKELTLVWRERNGRATLRSDATATLGELSQRGYRLGLISNTISSVDVPRSVNEYGWDKYFDVLILSSTSRRRKPDPEIFWEATRAMQVAPVHCAYLGDRISRDVVGSHKAGFGMAILIEPLGTARDDERDQTETPDALVHSLSELLEIFPSRVK